jgi:hypothetical protein
MIPYYADMSALTLTQAITQYKENILWMGDITKARLFLEAAMSIQLDKAQNNSAGGTGLTFEALQKNIDECMKFVKNSSSNPYGSFTRVKTVL